MKEELKVITEQLQNVKVEVEGAMAIVTMNRPTAMNALNNQTLGELNTLFDYFRKDKDILGTGHHSILKDGDRYYIAYHRFGTPLDKYPEGKGFHRETCIDELFFDENGFMKKVIVTN